MPGDLVTDQQLEELIVWHHRKTLHKSIGFFAKQIHTETASALKELKKLRAGVRVEGTVN